MQARRTAWAGHEAKVEMEEAVKGRKRFRGAMASYFTCVPSEGDVPAPLDVSAGLPD